MTPRFPQPFLDRLLDLVPFSDVLNLVSCCPRERPMRVWLIRNKSRFSLTIDHSAWEIKCFMDMYRPRVVSQRAGSMSAVHSKTTILALLNDFNEKIVTLPVGLTELRFGWGFNQSLSDVELPKGLTTLVFGFRYRQSLLGVNLPLALTELTFGHDFNCSLDRVRLPDGLRRLTLGRNFNQCVEKTVFPAGLTHLVFGFRFNRPMQYVALPKGLLVLDFGFAFDHDLDLDVLPRLRTLVIGQDYRRALARRDGLRILRRSLC